jgi:hypothetical protein
MGPCDSEFVLSMVVYLVLDGCTLTSEVYLVGGERFARAVGGVTRGWIAGGEMPGAEGFVEHLAEIRGEEDHAFRSLAVAELEPARSLA